MNQNILRMESTLKIRDFIPDLSLTPNYEELTETMNLAMNSLVDIQREVKEDILFRIAGVFNEIDAKLTRTDSYQTLNTELFLEKFDEHIAKTKSDPLMHETLKLFLTYFISIVRLKRTEMSSHEGFTRLLERLSNESNLTLT